MNTARLRLWWALLKHPTNIRMVMATLVEFTGIGLILYGLYLVHTFAFIIGMGGVCLLLAQGLSRRDES